MPNHPDTFMHTASSKIYFCKFLMAKRLRYDVSTEAKGLQINKKVRTEKCLKAIVIGL